MSKSYKEITGHTSAWLAPLRKDTPDVSRSFGALSQQLGVLRNEEVVSTRREGKNIYYSIAQPDVLRLLQTLHELFCERGAP